MDFEPEDSPATSRSVPPSIISTGKRPRRLSPTPRLHRFLPECFNTMRAVDSVVFVASAGGDLKVEAEKIFEEIKRLNCRGLRSFRV